MLAKLHEYEQQLVDPHWEAEAAAIGKNIGSLRRQMSILLDSFSEEGNPVLAEAVKSKVEALAEQIGACEQMAAATRSKVEQARQAREYLGALEQNIRGKVWQGEPTQREKAALAEAIGLQVVVTRGEGGTSVDFHAFTYDPPMFLMGGSNKKDLGLTSQSVLRLTQTRDRWRGGPAW